MLPRNLGAVELSTAQLDAIAGHEEESEDGDTTLDSDFLTVRIQGFDCDFSLINERLTGPAEFTFSPSLQTAAVSGTIVREDGRTVTVDVGWEGTGEIESTSNTTTFPGFTGLFKGKEREAVATGTVVVDGVTLIGGSTTNADLETLEDTNITTGSGE